MNILEQLLTIENIMLCFAIVALVWVQRRGLEVALAKVGKDLTKSKAWTEFFVPLGPLGTGMAMMQLKTLPIPELFSNGASARAVFGIGLGLLSGLVYKIVKKMLFDKVGKEDQKTIFED